MILIISTCKEPLHELEFVAPVVDILQEEELLILHYSELTPELLEHCERAIICGTSLQDNQFIDDLNSFSWIKSFEKPLLGICAGMQLLGLLFGGQLRKGTEIGYYRETFTDFLGLTGQQEVFHLHNQYVVFSQLEMFRMLSSSSIPQAVKHQEKELYGVLFHPEVRQEELLRAFARLDG